jgi:SAM-dependent methyltransferase
MSSTANEEVNLEEAIRDACPRYSCAAAIVAQVLEESPRFMRWQIDYQIRNRGAAFWEAAERLVKLTQGMGGNPSRSLSEYTVAYLREQVRFLKTGRYAHRDFEEARKAVYDNKDVMEAYYLEGLMLTHAFWPIHFDIHNFFMSEFVPRVPDRECGAEFGFGHGLYLLEVLTRRPGTFAYGFDISEYAGKYAARLLTRGGVSQDRYELGFADVRDRFEHADRSLQWIVFAEILEHVPDPLFSLREVCRVLAPGAPVFLTTVVNSNAVDHLWLFRSVGEVDAMVREAGLKVHSKQVFSVADYSSNAQDPTIDVAYVCETRG